MGKGTDQKVDALKAKIMVKSKTFVDATDKRYDALKAFVANNVNFKSELAKSAPTTKTATPAGPGKNAWKDQAKQMEEAAAALEKEPEKEPDERARRSRLHVASHEEPGTPFRAPSPYGAPYGASYGRRRSNAADRKFSNAPDRGAREPAYGCPNARCVGRLEDARRTT